MTDKRNKGNKIGDVNEPAKGTWPVIGTRAHPEDIHRIDRAALTVGVKRSVFLLQSALKEADRILGDEGANRTRQGERRQGERRAPFDGEAAAA